MGMILGLDVGGTHTDAVLVESAGVAGAVKVPTDARDLMGSVLTALEALTQEVDPRRIERAVLSTTLTTNAIVQGRTPPAGLLVTAGPGVDPEFYRPGPHFFVIDGAMDHRGREIAPIDPAQVRRAARRLEAEGIRQAAVVGKFSVRNPTHELAIAELLRPSCDTLFLGHRVAGGLSFPRRLATAFLDASVYPLHRDFFQAVKDSLRLKGLAMPIQILKADGGTLAFEASNGHPAQTILSGPSASVMGAVAFAPAQGDTLVLDIGGTTTDIALLVDRAPLLNPLGVELGGFKTLIRGLETRSIGIGGDSSVRVVQGVLRVGPERNGPALAHGGPLPTPTDALVLLGRVRGGDREASRQGIARLAGQLGIAPEEAAGRIVETACREILAAAEAMIRQTNSRPVYTIHALLEGRRVAPRTLLILGGPAPQFAAPLERLCGMPAGVLPRWEVANAIGAALARTTCEVDLFCDTERGVLCAPAEGVEQAVPRGFTRDEAIAQAMLLLRRKALAAGAAEGDLELEVVEALEFAMIRGFSRTGRNIRVRVQVKPGLVGGFDAVADALSHQRSAVPHLPAR
jgi:N-methylhydantoinase A/oxoprolinase/acetone carboxylase beta subunit